MVPNAARQINQNLRDVANFLMAAFKGNFKVDSSSRSVSISSGT